ncbi:FISUMP domain-containing protein [Paucihalobacter sp.]|uniref:FISUMP domain-containing protein n=1 Tax=Paucihalobacter sp. TaxID=2850405 RepID=UPI002FE080B1
MKNILLLLLLTTFIFSCSNDDDGLQDFETSFFTDPRDGQTYQIVKIGNQTWFAENLNYEAPNNLSSCYNNQETNCFTYGRLYSQSIAKSVCPDGYHLPTEQEWFELFNYFGGVDVAYAFLKPNGQVFGNQINFNLLAGGFRNLQNFQFLGEVGRYWFNFEVTTIPEGIGFNLDGNLGIATPGPDVGFSCRCIKD